MKFVDHYDAIAETLVYGTLRQREQCCKIIEMIYIGVAETAMICDPSMDTLVDTVPDVESFLDDWEFTGKRGLASLIRRRNSRPKVELYCQIADDWASKKPEMEGAMPVVEKFLVEIGVIK